MQKLVLITGGAIRIGSKIAEYFSINSWGVIIHYNNSQKAALELKEKIISQTGNKYIYIKKANLENIEETTALIKNINKEIGIIDLLINNAAVFKNDNIFNIKSENIEQHLKINLVSPLLLIQAFIEQYKGSEGNIINILDYVVSKPPNKFLSYVISKSALWNATIMIAQMIAPNIRINSIGPGPTFANERQSIESFTRSCSANLLNIGSTYEEICNTIEYILKTKSVTGQLFNLDSGRNIGNFEYI